MQQLFEAVVHETEMPQSLIASKDFCSSVIGELQKNLWTLQVSWIVNGKKNK